MSNHNGSSTNETNDLTILVPPATSGDVDLEQYVQPADQVEVLLDAEAKLQRIVQEQQLVLTSFANIIASLVKICTEMAGLSRLELIVDRVLVDRMEGAKVTLTELDPVSHDVLVQIRERVGAHQWEVR